MPCEGISNCFSLVSSVSFYRRTNSGTVFNFVSNVRAMSGGGGEIKDGNCHL